jgi:hypothetical protein
MIFTYWASSSAEEAPSAAAWRARYPEFRVYRDADVRPLLSPDRLSFFDEIAIPACKSDIARLFLLREHGGLYLDAHAGPAEAERLAETLGALAQFDLILFCRSYLKKSPNELHLMNGAIAARQHTPFLDMLIICAFGHLADQRAAEQATTEHVHYTLWGMAGTWILLKSFFDLSKQPFELREEYKDRILVRYLDSPVSPGFEMYQFYNYRSPGQHWSERQKVERLFGPPLIEPGKGEVIHPTA